MYKARNNDSIHRDDVIASLAKIVREADMGHTVDLNNPDLTICVEIVRVSREKIFSMNYLAKEC